MAELMIYPVTEETGTGREVNKEGVCVGIDLGTTYSLMCIVDPRNVNLKESTRIPVQFITVPQESPFPYDSTIEDEKVASIVAIHEGRPYVGNNLYHLKGHPGFTYKHNMFYHWKVEMGIDHHPMYPDAISDKLDMPYKIAGGILNYMKRSFVGDHPLNNTIITVPASFQANQRKDTLKAAEMAKIETRDNMLIDEPNAAFLGFFNRLSHDEKQTWAKNVKNKNVLVIDFGGGTLDLSILNVDFRQDKGITISNRAISRYNDLGGQDIDMLIAEEFLVPKLKKVFDDFDSIDISDIKNTLIPQLSVIAEDLKIGICDKLNLKAGDKDVQTLDLKDVVFTRKDCNLVYKKEELNLEDISINGEEFKTLFTKFFRGSNYKFKYQDKTVTTVSTSINEIIEKADLGLDEIDYVLFVGGSSFNPLLPSLCKDKLLNSEPLTSHEPDKLVAEGAAVYSYFLNTHGISLISPITSDTIGVRLKNNRFFPIIEKGQSLPQQVNIPDFKLQSNMTSEVVVPVCMNGADFPIGEIRSRLNAFYDIDSVVQIKASITTDKVFSMKVFINEDLIGNVEFENPYAIGKVTEEELEVYELRSKLNKAEQLKNRGQEKTYLRELIWKYSNAKNYLGSLECAEKYVKRFSDQDSAVWNMIYISNNRLGRQGAALKALDRAIELDPEEPTWRLNYSFMLERSAGARNALEYLQKLNESIKKDSSIRCRMVILKGKLDIPCEAEAKAITKEYKSSPHKFSDYDKAHLLKNVFDIAEEPYSYVDPKTTRNLEDEGKYLDVNNLPF